MEPLPLLYPGGSSTAFVDPIFVVAIAKDQVVRELPGYKGIRAAR